MNQIQQLINQMCPNGVEWKPLGEVCEKVSSGGTPNTKKANYYNGNIPWLRTQEVDFCDITDTGIKITNEGLENSSAKWIPANCVIIAMYGATVGKVAINKIPLTTNQACCNLEINDKVASYRFVYYCLENQYNYIKSLGQGSQTNINAQIVKQLLIPFPPLAIQTRIVEILDHFTNLTANLTAELNLRRKQFEHYREKLLSLDGVEGVEWKKLGEVCEMHGRIGWQGLTKKDYRATGKYLLVTGTDFLSSNKINYNTCVYVDEDRYTQDKYIQLKENDLLITKDGTIGKLAIVQDLPMPATLNGGVFVIRDKTKTLDHRFLMYIMASSHFKNQIEKKHTNGTIKHLTQNLLVSYAIPVPPLATQHSIVSILDKFTALIENIEKELALRQKQYEYYREELLRFGG